MRPQQLLLCITERTLLPVVLPAKGSEPVTVKLAAEVAEMLAAIGIPDGLIRAELARMAAYSGAT